MPTPVRASRLAVVLLTALALVVPQLASAQSIEQARAERIALQERLDAVAMELADLQARIGELENDKARLTEQMAALQAEADEATERVAERLRELYKRGIDSPVIQMLSGDDAAEALERAELAQQILTDDRALVETAVAARRNVSIVADELALRQAELDAALAEQEAAQEALEADFQRAAELEERLVAEEAERQRQLEEERQRKAAEERRRQEAERQRQEAAAAAAAAAAEAAAEPAPEPASEPSSGGGGGGGGAYACPVSQPRSYTDTWGAPRSGGRRHQGTDILNPRGNEVIAITNGSWDVRTPGSLSGNWGMLRGDDGHTYYYMHLQQHLAGDGARVTAGEVIALNGDTGNARGTPHVHFEYHPGGGGAVNPYPLVYSLCG